MTLDVFLFFSAGLPRRLATGCLLTTPKEAAATKSTLTKHSSFLKD
jgi:hypothetical protein